MYKFTTLSNGAEFVGVGEGEQRASLDDLAKAINAKTRVAFICNPNNPTGAYYTEKEIVDFLGKVPQNVLVFLDEAYAEFATAEDFPHLASKLEQFPNLFINRTFSKIYGLAGLRIGYAVSSEATVKAMWKIKPPFDVNQAAQVAAIAAFADSLHLYPRGDAPKLLDAIAQKYGVKKSQIIIVGMPEHIRITVGKPEENAFLVALVKKWKAEA